VLRNNGADDLPVAANATSFQFATPVAYGGNYSATVQQQPVSQTCVVANGSGSNVGNHVANIAVTCSVNTYTVGGSVSGYGSSGLVLQNNGTDDAAIPVSGPFTFPTPIAAGAVYNVTVLAQPTGETCSVSNGSGTMSSANVTNVQVSCAPSITITNISPASGPEIGGTTVVINGTNFASLTDVYFGGVPASFMVLNSSMLSAVAPAGIGVVDITLVGTDSSATVVSGYTYDP
jgi:hypothetical protein